MKVHETRLAALEEQARRCQAQPGPCRDNSPSCHELLALIDEVRASRKPGPRPAPAAVAVVNEGAWGPAAAVDLDVDGDFLR